MNLMKKIINKLETKTSYVNTWNFFSKSQIIKESISSNSSILIVAENNEQINSYKNIFEHLNINVKKLENINDVINIKTNKKWLYLTTSEILNKDIISNYELNKLQLKLKTKDTISSDELIKNLNNLWLKFSEYAIKWSYKRNGDLITIMDFDGIFSYKISLWWDEIEEIIAEENRESLVRDSSKVDSISLWSDKSPFSDGKEKDKLIDYIKDAFIILDSLDFTQYYKDYVWTLKNYCCFDLIWNKTLRLINLRIKDFHINSLEDFKNFLLDKNNKKTIYTKNSKLIDEFLQYNNISDVIVYQTNSNKLQSYRIKKEDKLTLVICDDIISKIFIKRRVKKKLSKDIDLLLKVKAWDYIVHIDHGIWIFKWIIEKELNNIKKEYIEILYKEDDKLFVPVTECSRISKYIGSENPKLTWLNSKEWEKKIKKVNEDIQIIAEELLDNFAKRKINNGFSFFLDERKINEFQSSFPFEYTDDQNHSIKDILDDMSKVKNMDRLLVWDVWFWKTEIAFNAAYNAFLNKKQVVFISPLVVLAYEHYNKAQERFKWLWVKIDVLTRLESTKNVNNVLKKIKEWKTDIVIWTHKLLSDSINYKDLWLIIIDEEHKFWVQHKEKIKTWKANIDMLAMSATPIPRSLNMALSSIRDISIIKHAPFWRKSIKTSVTKYSEEIIFEACEKEFERWWQVFFIHNKVKNIEIYKRSLQELFPDKKIVVTHGQLEWTQLEKRIIDFKNRKYDILLSTTVIENGIDFANVNTIFINECQNFWISQIHQLRWRVWRSDKQWYCYLLYKKENLGTDTAKRLKTIVEYSYLGAWFELAMKDLEIRWSWDILWIRQSWQAKEIWVNLFIKMLEEKVEELKENSQQTIRDNIDISVDLKIWASIPIEYFSSESDKLNFYREIESLDNLDDLDELTLSFKKVNPNFTPEVENLFDIIKLKIKAKKYYIQSIKRVWINYQVEFNKNIKLENLKGFLKLDKEVNFAVVSINKIRASVKNFANDKKFLQYMLLLFDSKLWNPKIKLKSR